MAGGKNIKSTVKNFPRFEFKGGLGPFRWGGMHLDGDPSSIPVNQPRIIINGRIEDGVIRNRAGLAKLDASAVGDSANCIGAIAALDPPPLRIYFITNYCSGGLGCTIYLADSELDNEIQIAGKIYAQVAHNVVLGKYGQYLYVSSKGRLMRFDPQQIPYGVSNPGSGIVADVIFDFGLGKDIAFIQEFGGLLFIGVNDVGGDDRVYSYDGVTVAAELSAAGPLGQGTCLYRDLMVFGYTTTNKITYRTADGTYTDVVPGAGTLPDPIAMLSWQDNVYIVGSTTSIWLFTGTAVSSVRTIATAVNFKGLAELRGQLFFAYNEAASARIGKYDGANWTNVEKNLTAQFSNVPELGGMVSYRERLAVTARIDPASPSLYFSDGFVTNGSWVGTNPSLTPAGLAYSPIVV